MKDILIIEDDLHIAELERDYLQFNGYAATVVQDGAEGLQMAVTGRFDLIIVDLMLPHKDGFEITKAIREKLEIPVIIVSAKNEDIDKIRGLGLGADDYLTKPFSPAELVARIKSHIARYERLQGKGLGTEIIHHQGIEINPVAHKVFVQGKEVQMTTTEFDLLLFFAQNPDMVFSKEHLLDRIWGFEYSGDTATVSVHIQKIRKKIERDPANPVVIETIWGTGYRLNS